MKRALVAWLVTAELSGAAAAQGVQQYGIFTYNPALPRALTLQGEIGEDVMALLRQALREHPETGTLFLDSPGGSVFPALELGAALHDRGLATVVPEGAECASSCAYVFIAGKQRVLRGRLGVHQFSSPDGDAVVPESETQGVIGEIVSYLRDFNTPVIFILRMLDTPNDDMHWFTVTEISEGTMDTGLDYAAQLAIWSTHYKPWTDPEDMHDVAPGENATTSPWLIPFTAPVSVDCALHSSAAWHRAICGNAWLSEINITLRDEERTAVSHLAGGEATAHLAQQWEWVKARNACEADEKCITDISLRRMAETEAILDTRRYRISRP